MPLHQPAPTAPSFNLIPDLFQATTQSASSMQSTETCSLQEEASLNSPDESPTATHDLSLPPQPSLRMHVSASPAPAPTGVPAQTHPVTGWVPASSAPTQLRMLAAGGLRGGGMAVAAAAPSRQPHTTAPAGSIPPRGRSPLSSFHPPQTAARPAEPGAVPRADRARLDYSHGAGGPQPGAAAVVRRDRSRSPERASHLRMSRPLSAVGRVMNLNSGIVRPATRSQRDQTQQHAMPVMLAFVQAGGVSAGPRLPEGLVTSVDAGGTSQAHHHPLPAET